MKKIVSILCLVVLMASMMLFVGCSCKNCNSDVPPDHQLASIPEIDGFTLYLPEEWKYIRSNDAIVAQVSALNTLTFTAARVKPYDADAVNDTIVSYWAKYEEELKVMLTPATGEDGVAKPTTYKLNNSGNATAHDPAKQNWEYAYYYDYTGIFPGKTETYRVLQYFIVIGTKPSDGMVILTMMGSNEAKATTGNVDFNDDMIEKFEKILDVIIVSEERGKDYNKYQGDNEDAPEGMKNATVNTHLGVTVYVPDAWKVTESDGFIGVISSDDKANLSISPVATDSGLKTIEDYWRIMTEKYTAYFDEGTFEIDEKLYEVKTDEEGKTLPVKFEDAEQIGDSLCFSARFHGKVNGKEYTMSLYILREDNNRPNSPWFSILLTSKKSADHDSYLADVERILQEVRY